jgi:hypothetical protein
MSEGAHLNDTELAGFVDNRLDEASRKRAIAHLDICNDCRAELIATTSLVRGTPSSSLRPIVSPWRRGRVWALAGAGALAAAVAGIVLFRGPIGPVIETVRTPIVGSTESPRIMAVAPRDGALVQSPADRVFTWRAYDSDNYRFVLLEEDGTPLWSLDTHDTSLVLPADISLRPGGTYFWRVDAHADGITASSGTMRLQVPR